MEFATVSEWRAKGYEPKPDAKPFDFKGVMFYLFSQVQPIKLGVH